jgi:hypothetical protein
MGFINREANIQGIINKNINIQTIKLNHLCVFFFLFLKALNATMGDVNAAIDRLLNQQSQL